MVAMVATLTLTVADAADSAPVVHSLERIPNGSNPPRLTAPSTENIIFPTNSGIVDITLAPYLAKADGIADNTQAIQSALDDHPNAGAIIYLPNEPILYQKRCAGRVGAAMGQNTRTPFCKARVAPAPSSG